MKKFLITSAIVLSGGVLVGCSLGGQTPEEKAVIESQMAAVNFYETYSASAVPADQPYVLFFHADWCPTCVKWEKNILGATLPDNAMIFKVDYDNEQALREQYGVAKQSTAVFVSADGTTELAKDPSVEAVSAFFEGGVSSEVSEESAGVVVSKEVAAVLPVLGDVSVNAVVVEDDAPMYKTYSATNVPTDQKYAVYFHADWCPSCVAMGKKIEASLSELPEGTVVLKANYDKESELKKQYGVTSQHTLVTINADGSVAGVKKGGNVDDIKAFFN